MTLKDKVIAYPLPPSCTYHMYIENLPVSLYMCSRARARVPEGVMLESPTVYCSVSSTHHIQCKPTNLTFPPTNLNGTMFALVSSTISTRLPSSAGTVPFGEAGPRRVSDHRTNQPIETYLPQRVHMCTRLKLPGSIL